MTAEARLWRAPYSRSVVDVPYADRQIGRKIVREARYVIKKAAAT
jgi:hypothetical protein